MNQNEEAFILELLDDPIKFCSVLKIIGKNKKKITLEPTSEQIEILNALLTGKHCLFLKPRQIGATTIIIAFLFWCGLVAEDAIVIVLLAHKEKPAKKLLRRIKYMWENLPIEFRPPLKTNSTTEFVFEHNGAGIYVESGQQDGGVRSDSIHLMHITEINFTPKALELLTTAKSAVNDNPLILESTANHSGDPLYQEIKKYMNGSYKRSQYEYCFFSWLRHENYSRNPIGYRWAEEEIAFKKQTGCTDAQLAWRQDQIAKHGYEKFVREYPISFEEAYMVTGSTYFNYKDFLNVAEVATNGTEWLKLGVMDDKGEMIVEPSDSFAVGVDVGGGVGKNYTVVFAASKRTMQPVVVWRSNKYDPIAAAEYVVLIARLLNNAKVLVEVNNHGLAMINEITHQGYMNLWQNEDSKHFNTNLKTKNLIFANLRKMIRSGYVKLLDELTRQELLMVIDDNGLIKFGEENNSHCDNAMAMALCYWCLNSVAIKQSAFLPDWIRKKKSDSIKQSGGISVGNHRRY
jgi:hypothetical protein